MKFLSNVVSILDQFVGLWHLLIIAICMVIVCQLHFVVFVVQKNYRAECEDNRQEQLRQKDKPLEYGQIIQVCLTSAVHGKSFTFQVFN